MEIGYVTEVIVLRGLASSTKVIHGVKPQVGKISAPVEARSSVSRGGSYASNISSSSVLFGRYLPMVHHFSSIKCHSSWGRRFVCKTGDRDRHLRGRVCGRGIGGLPEIPNKSSQYPESSCCFSDGSDEPKLRSQFARSVARVQALPG